MDFKKVNEDLKQQIDANNKAIKEYAFREGWFKLNGEKFRCGINPQGKIAIEPIIATNLHNIFAYEDEDGYFKFAKQNQEVLTTKYCENRKEVAEEILRLMNKKNESVTELSSMTKQDIDNVMEVLRNDNKHYYDNHITHHVLYISAIQKRIPEFIGMTETEVGDILSKLGYPVSYNPYATMDFFVADEKMSYEEFNKWVENIPSMMDESVEEDTEFDEFKSTLTRTENTEIGAELLDKDFAGELYLTAEEFSRNERSDLASWCCAMVDAANGKATINVEQFITWLAKKLNRIMNDKNIQERKLSDDGYAYAINSLDMPNKLAEFAKALDLEEVANALLNSEYCVKAMKLAQELEEEYNNLQK